MLSLLHDDPSAQTYESWLAALWDIAGSTMSRDERAQHLLAFSQLVFRELRLHIVCSHSRNTTGGPAAEKVQEAARAAPEGDR